jgi:hypothetical protein
MGMHFEAHPEALKFKGEPLDFRGKLGFLLGEALATGEVVCTIDEGLQSTRREDESSVKPNLNLKALPMRYYKRSDQSSKEEPKVIKY